MKLPAWLIGEFFGTFLLVFFGCGVVCASVTTGAQTGVFQVAIVWGLGIATAIYLCGNAIASFERTNDIDRGRPGSEASAMVFGEFFPNPGGRPLTAESRERMSAVAAFGAEVVGTAILLLVIFCATDERNGSRPQVLTAATIGLTVTLLISLLGPLTMACFNPARDLAPRVFSSLAGWSHIPFEVNGMGWLTVYVVAPLLGGLVGGAVYTCFFKKLYGAAAS
jgi:glycerol uptake facilitator protein